MGKWYFSILPMIMISVGTYLTNKDADDKGPDDAIGKVLIAAAPAIEGLANKNESSVRKSLKAARDVIDGYLATPSPASA